MNKTILIGRITKDHELKKTNNGNSVLNFTLAVNRGYQPKDPSQPSADFISCQAWNKTAELLATYTGKGSQIALEGRIQTRNYEDSTGRKVYVTEVIADRVEFLDLKKESSERSYQDEYQEATEPTLDINDDDLPF